MTGNWKRHILGVAILGLYLAATLMMRAYVAPGYMPLRVVASLMFLYAVLLCSRTQTGVRYRELIGRK